MKLYKIEFSDGRKKSAVMSAKSWKDAQRSCIILFGSGFLITKIK